jgi:hypothetical protein
MNALTRFIKFGALDANRRVAGILAPRPVGVADRHVKSSVVVRTFDRFTRMLWASICGSETGRAASAARDAWGRAGWSDRYRTIGLVLIVAASVHVAATIMQGPRPGWFWLIVPALTSGFAVLLLMAARSMHSK